MSNQKLTEHRAAALGITSIIGITIMVCFGLWMGHDGALIMGGMASIAGIGGGIPIGAKLRDILSK